MRFLKANKRMLPVLAGGALLVAAFTYTTAPVNSVSTVTMSGTAAATLALSAGNTANATLTGGTGAGGTITPAATDTADGFNDVVNFGTLSAGDGTNEVATIPLRVRGNSACHVSWKCTSYTASNISYSGTALTGSAASSAQLSFIQLGTNAMSAGTNASTTGATYQASFLNSLPLSNGNAGVISAAVTGTDEKFVSFTNPPSLSGSITDPQNYVETYARFSVPTGFAWASTGASPTWSTTVSFILASGA